MVIEAYEKSGLGEVDGKDLEKIKIPDREPKPTANPPEDASAADASSSAAEVGTETASSMVRAAPTIDPLVTEGAATGATDAAGGAEAIGGGLATEGIIGAILAPIALALALVATIAPTAN